MMILGNRFLLGFLTFHGDNTHIYISISISIGYIYILVRTDHLPFFYLQGTVSEIGHNTDGLGCTTLRCFWANR